MQRAGIIPLSSLITITFLHLQFAFSLIPVPFLLFLLSLPIPVVYGSITARVDPNLGNPTVNTNVSILWSREPDDPHDFFIAKQPLQNNGKTPKVASSVEVNVDKGTTNGTAVLFFKLTGQHVLLVFDNVEDNQLQKLLFTSPPFSLVEADGEAGNNGGTAETTSVKSTSTSPLSTAAPILTVTVSSTLMSTSASSPSLASDVSSSQNWADTHTAVVIGIVMGGLFVLLLTVVAVVVYRRSTRGVSRGGVQFGLESGTGRNGRAESPPDSQSYPFAHQEKPGMNTNHPQSAWSPDRSQSWIPDPRFGYTARSLYTTETPYFDQSPYTNRSPYPNNPRYSGSEYSTESRYIYPAERSSFPTPSQSAYVGIEPPTRSVDTSRRSIDNTRRSFADSEMGKIASSEIEGRALRLVSFTDGEHTLRPSSQQLELQERIYEVQTQMMSLTGEELRQTRTYMEGLTALLHVGAQA